MKSYKLKVYYNFPNNILKIGKEKTFNFPKRILHLTLEKNITLNFPKKFCFNKRFKF